MAMTLKEFAELKAEEERDVTQQEETPKAEEKKELSIKEKYKEATGKQWNNEYKKHKIIRVEQSLSKAFKTFLSARINEHWGAEHFTGTYQYEINDIYEEAGQKRKELYKEIEEYLPKKAENILEIYDEIITLQEGYELEDAYRKGFLDGIEFKKMITAWSEGKEPLEIMNFAAEKPVN